MTKEEKQIAVFEAATDVFSKYGFRRTSMNDIAEAAGISRPALYLMFDNKEDLFRHLANFRQDQAIEALTNILSEDAPIADRVVQALLAYERIFYEPVAASPHVDDLVDLSQSVAADDMLKGRNRLIRLIAESIDQAVSDGEVKFIDNSVTAKQFSELLMSSLIGQKKAATSIKDFRKRVESVTSIFMASIAHDTDT